MKVYNQEDKSLIEYYTNDINELDQIQPETKDVNEFSRFYNRNYDIIANIEEKLTKNTPNQQSAEDNMDLNEVEKSLEGYNMLSLFSLAKIKSTEAQANTLALKK